VLGQELAALLVVERDQNHGLLHFRSPRFRCEPWHLFNCGLPHHGTATLSGSRFASGSRSSTIQ
jgi:hypothetical protein